MKKLILSLVTSFFIIGCGENTTGQKRHDPNHHENIRLTSKLTTH